uniref:PUB domain-containing protein n=1 Tax=Plectus sambesii TaxID=2011161 RepID=A0A914WEH1_9BILA
MDKIKNFFDKKKKNKTFKKAGPGQSLAGASASSGSVSRPSTHPGSHAANVPVTQERIHAADIAAHAAMKRLNLDKSQPNRSQQAIRLQAKREMDQDRQRQAEAGSFAALAGQQREPERKEFEHAPVLAVEGVFFTCELLGDDIVLPKQQMTEVVGEFLEEQMKEDALVASVLMVHSLNKSEPRRIALETIGRYVDNLITNPEEEKFRRIRLSNKVFQERVISARGGVEFLKAIGFLETMMAPADGQPEEPFLVMPLDAAKDREQLEQAKDVLISGVPVPLKLHRNPSVLKAATDQPLSNPKVPNDFFSVSSAEIKAEQMAKSDEVDRLLTLRTKEMRDRDETLRQYRYKYSLIRIRFPDGFGTFDCYEKFAEVRAFVRSKLAADDWVPFHLRDAISGVEITPEKDDQTIGDLKLAPAAYVRFDWDSDVLQEWSKKNAEIPYLRKELIETAEPLL